MNLTQREIEIILDWHREMMSRRVFSIEELDLIKKLIENHVRIRREVQVEEMSREAKDLLRNRNKSLDNRRNL